MRNEIVFNDKQNVIDLNLPELQLTADYKGMRKHEISHHRIMDDLLKDLNGRGYDAKLATLLVSKNGVDYPTTREVETKGYLTSVNDIRGVIVRNCIGRIDITGDGLSDKFTNQQIAISYNKQGIALAMGTNVQICSNMNIFGGQMMQNYGTGSVPILRMLDLMASWIQNMRQFRERDLAIHKLLKEAKIDPLREVDEVVGHLHRLCEMQKADSKVMAPLNHSRIHDLQRGMLQYEGEMATAYDFYQAATEVSTHQQVIENRLANTSDLVSFFQDRYNAIKEMAETVESEDAIVS